MKKSKLFYLYAICAVLFMSFVFPACQQASSSSPSDDKDDGKAFYIKNSRWQDMDIDTMRTVINAKSSGRSMAAARSMDTARAVDTLTDALAVVEAYNDAVNDDQAFLYTEDVDVTESPLVDIFYVNEGDYADLGSEIGVLRTEFIRRYSTYQNEARFRGALLFIDKVPPVPIIPPDERSDDEKYVIYLINSYGYIVAEKHCYADFYHLKETEPTTFDYKTVDQYFDAMVSAYHFDTYLAYGDGRPYWIQYGKYYYEPGTEPPEE
jgi:hypothetical protein